MDMENLGAAPDIDKFDASALDRGDSLAAPEVKPDPVVEDKVEDIFEPKDDPKDEVVEPKDDPKDEVVDEPEDEKPRGKDGKFEAKIPKSRFDEAVGKERDAREAAERRAAELERQLKAGEQAAVRTVEVEKIEAELSAMEEKHAELITDGKAKEAAAVMKEIRMAERQIARAEADAAANQRITQTLEKQKFDTVVARIEADNPEFNPESEQYDSDLVELVLTKQSNLIRSQGLTPSVAMDMAAKDVAARFLTKQEAKEEAKGLSKANAAEDRKQEQVKKNLDTQKRQPASLKESGIDSDKLGKTSEMDMSTMTADEINALPEATRARLRGDYV